MGHAAFMLAAFSVTMTAVIFADPSNLPKQLLSDDGGSVAFPQDNNDQDHQRRIAHRQRWHSTAIAYECYLHFEAWIQFAEERSPVFILDEAEKTSSCVNGPNHYRLQSLESLGSHPRHKWWSAFGVWVRVDRWSRWRSKQSLTLLRSRKKCWEIFPLTLSLELWPRSRGESGAESVDPHPRSSKAMMADATATVQALRWSQIHRELLASLRSLDALLHDMHYLPCRPISERLKMNRRFYNVIEWSLTLKKTDTKKHVFYNQNSIMHGFMSVYEEGYELLQAHFSLVFLAGDSWTVE